jgi:hypothetical protein
MPDIYSLSAFFARTDEEHRWLGEEYANLKTAKARDDFVKKHATRWTELSHLPYFDTVRMIIIDPMHNLLLGKFAMKFAT